MSSRLTTRHKELATGLGALTIAMVLWIAASLTESERDSTVLEASTVNVGAQPVGEILAKQPTENSRQAKAFPENAAGLRLPVPGSRFHGVEFNSLGFRGPEPENIAADKPHSLAADEPIRILYLGNSVTLDIRSEGWPALTTEKLAEVFPDCRFTHQNGGIPGVNTRGQRDYFLAMRARYKPDIVVLMTDDRKATSTLMLKRLGRDHDQATRLVLTRENTVSRYRTDLPQLLGAIREHNATPVLLSFGQWARRNQSAGDLARATRRYRAREPYMTAQGFLDAADWYNEVNAEVAEKQGVTYIEWHRRVPGKARYFRDLKHFREAGSALMAKVLAQELRNSSLFSQILSSRFGCGG